VLILYLTSLLYLTLGIIIILLGFIIFKENFRQRINRITGVMMFFAGTGPVFAAFGLLLQTSAVTHIDIEFFQKIFLVWEFFFPQMVLFALVFPREIKWAERHHYLVYLIFIPHLVHFFLVLSFSSPDQVRTLLNLQAISDRFGLIIQPVTILLGFSLSLMSLIYEFHTNFFALINLIYIIAAITVMTWEYRKLKSLHFKKQVGLVLWGIRSSVGLYAIAFIFPHLHIIHMTEIAAHLLTSIALLIGAGSIAWAIIRYQFMDIRLIIRRGLIFSLASAVLIGLYLLIYSEGKKFFNTIVGVDVPILEILFIILALIFFQPILSSVEKLIERIFMKDKMDYRNVLQNLSHEIITTLDPLVLQRKITTTLKEVMSLEQVELFSLQRNGTFSTGKNNFSFKPDEEWIQILKEVKSPISCDELLLRIGSDRALERLQKLNGFLLVPLIHQENLVGILVLGQKITRTTFTTEEMTILSVLSNQAAIALENGRLHQEIIEKQRMEEELFLAREIQQNLLPCDHPENENFELVGYNLPSREVGGDYYDFISLDEHRIGIAIGDISGKGIPAAMLMSNLQAALRISALQTQNTSKVIKQLNIHITRTTSPEKFATFFYSVFDIHNFTLEYTNAGHNFPILWHRSGTYSSLRQGGIVIGVMKDAVYRSNRVTLKPGDFLVMYTDGVTEAVNPYDEVFGEQRLIHVLGKTTQQSAKGIMETVLNAVIDFTHGHLQSDDLTLVVLKIK